VAGTSVLVAWIVLDAFQLCLILCVPQFGLPSLKTAEILAGVYVFFLFIDFGYLFRAGRILNCRIAGK
jgi:hypothetical protein